MQRNGHQRPLCLVQFCQPRIPESACQELRQQPAQMQPTLIFETVDQCPHRILGMIGRHGKIKMQLQVRAISATEFARECAVVRFAAETAKGRSYARQRIHA